MSFYVVPVAGTGTKADPFVPSFVPALGVSYTMIQLGNSAIAWADATAAQDTSIGANAGVIVVPPLDNQIGAGALATVQADVEALNIPADWVAASMTYRVVLRVIVGMAQLIQRVQGMGVNPVIAGNLSKALSTFPANVLTTLAAAVDSFGLDRSQISGSTTLRAALFNIGTQFAAGAASISIGNL